MPSSSKSSSPASTSTYRRRGRRGRERERAALQALVDDQIPGPIPDQHLDPIASAIQEHKEMSTLGLLPHHAARGGRQAIKPATQVYGLGRHKDAHRRGQRQHGVRSSRTANTRRRSSVATPGATRTRRPRPISMSMYRSSRPGAPSSATRTGWKCSVASPDRSSRVARRETRRGSRWRRATKPETDSPLSRQASTIRRASSSANTIDQPAP
jgi:hypothetical protein